MTTARLTLCALLVLASTAATAQSTICVKDGNKPGDCFVLQPIPGLRDNPTTPAPTPSAAPATPAPSSDSPTSVTNTVSGDVSRSVAAVFPAPSLAVVPTAHDCIVTRSTTGGFGWNLIQGASSEQYSDPVCVLQWLLERSTSTAEAQALRAAIVKRIGGL